MKPLKVSSLYKNPDLSSAMPVLWLLSNIFPPNEPLFLFLCSVGARIKVQNITECNFLYATPDFRLWRQDLTVDLPMKACWNQMSQKNRLQTKRLLGVVTRWVDDFVAGGSKGARWQLVWNTKHKTQNTWNWDFVSQFQTYGDRVK